MLYIVQAVLWGVAEAPQVFHDETEARAAYVASAAKQWDQRYGAYCEHHGLDRGAFAAAQAFVDSIDVSEKSRLHFWGVTPEEAGLGAAHNPAGGPQREEFQQVAKDIGAVREGLARLLDDVSRLDDHCARMAGMPPEDQEIAARETAKPVPSPLPLQKPQPDPERYTRPEWKSFVGSMTRLGSGPRNDFYLLPRDDWRQAVYSNLTAFEYWEWVADSVMTYKELAQSAHYSVIASPDALGDFRFANREGIASEESYGSELEAWCAAGLHAEATCMAASE